MIFEFCIVENPVIYRTSSKGQNNKTVGAKNTAVSSIECVAFLTSQNPTMIEKMYEMNMNNTN